MYVNKARTDKNEILWLINFDDTEECDRFLGNLRGLSKRLYAQEGDELPEDEENLECYYESVKQGKEFIAITNSLEKRCFKGKGTDIITFVNLEEISTFMGHLLILSFGGNVALEVKDDIISEQEEIIVAYRQHIEMSRLNNAPPTGVYS